MKQTYFSATDRTFRREKRPSLAPFIYPVTLAAALLGLTLDPVRAGTVSVSSTAPAVGSSDIAQLLGNSPGSTFDVGKWWPGTEHPGQTFTPTGNARLKAFTLKSTTSTEPNKIYTIRVSTVSGSTLSVLHTESGTQTNSLPASGFITFRLDTPVLLTAGTLYGVDLQIVSSTSVYQTGIPYLPYQSTNTYAGGTYYRFASGATNITTVAGSDRTFHLDLEHPMRPSPESGASVPAGNVELSWSNLSPNTGTDVWVDVWFGTNSGALTQVVTKGLNVTNTTVTAPGAATYYWRVNSYLDGVSTGTPVQGALFNFVVFDSDSDGIPDWYELANTTNPQSATALTPTGDDDGDTLTNLNEYQRGTRANLADTDGDTLNDGAEVAGAGARPPTSPLLTDTDGDGLRDDAESNTGTWVGTADTGTNPTKTDTDADSLRDGAETFTSVYVSPTNTGTSPLLKDTDGDGAGDWYEVTATFTDPNAATNKPNIPYPLPTANSTTPATNKPVKVFILSGQSNMVGIGDVDPASTLGTLSAITKNQGKFPHLLNSNGTWVARNDVTYKGVITATGAGPLTAGQGSGGTTLGPELGFGSVMGYYYDEPVLLLKASQGNRGLFWDILPPGSPRWTNGATVYAGYGEAPNSWATNSGPSPYGWYAGKQYDDFFLDEEDMGATAWANGQTYKTNQIVKHNNLVYVHKSLPPNVANANSEPGVGAQSSTYWTVYSVSNVVDVLDNFNTTYPAYAAQGFEIAGYVWFQGNWDIGSAEAANRYETNLVNFIKQVRGYFANRYPTKCTTNTPFVLATGCGDPGTSGNGLIVANAQLAMNNTVKYSCFAGSVKTMDTRGYWRDVSVSPMNQGYHYNHNAETYMLTGDALARGMIDMLSPAAVTTNDYSSWAASFPGANLTDPNGDYDGDGRGNDYERIWGLNPTNAVSNNPFTFDAALKNGTFSYTRRDPALTGLAYTIWTSTNLVNWAQDLGASQTPGAPVNQIQPVSVTVSPGLLPGPQLFMRVRAQ